MISMIRILPLAALLLAGSADATLAQDAPPKPIGQFLSVRSPIDDSVIGRVRKVAQDLAIRTEKESRPAVLVLELAPGNSPVHQVQGLASLLSSARLSRVRTVAWIPKSVTGLNAVVALSCNEIVMHPDANLGDISRGEPLDDASRQFVQTLVDKRRNAKVNWPLARGMLDRNAEVIRATITGEDKQVKSRVVGPDELQLIQKSNPKAVIEVSRIKDSDDLGIFSGEQARQLDILVTQTAETRSDVAAIYGLPARAMKEEKSSRGETIARLIKIDGPIEPMLHRFFNQQLARAIAEKATVIIFEIDSPGGLLTLAETMANDIAALEERGIHTVAWIPREAISGAAIVSLGCDDIYMHPEARIGDAAPIEMKEGMAFERAPEKVLSYTREVLRTLAEKKGRPPGLAEAMADKDLKVFRVVNPQTGEIEFKTEAELHAAKQEFGDRQLVAETREDNLLTVNGRQAHELQLAEPPVSGMEELKQRLGIPRAVELRAIERTWVDNVASMLSGGGSAFMLFFFGSILIYLELHTQVGLCGIGSAVCFTLFFWARWGGTAGWLELALFLLGLALVAIEIFLIPGFGVFGISGGLLVFIALVMASETMTGSPSFQGLQKFGAPTATLMGSLLTVIAVAAVISHYLPQLPLLRRIVLEPPGTGELAFDPQLVGSPDPTGLLNADHGLVGQLGGAISVLRPAGKAKIGDDLVDVVSDGPFINPGVSIQVVRVEGNRVFVREVDETS
jgi:membrane-bound serine protease (ClpP class)